MKESARARDFASFRAAARALLERHVAPGDVAWVDELSAQASLFGAEKAGDSAPATTASRVPRRYVELAELSALHRSPDRFDVLYRVLFRLTHGEPELLADELDRDVRELSLRVAAVRRDEHRMHAFVRFRESTLEGETRYIAWYEPEHYIVRLAAPFFARRFAAMRWSILTPDELASWDGTSLAFGPGATRSQAPSDDRLEELFRTYYAATYNPARQNPKLFEHHVPRAFRRHMPELAVLPAQPPVPDRTAASATAQPLVPETRVLAQLAGAARGCAACPLAGPATQTVFGEAPRTHACSWWASSRAIRKIWAAGPSSVPLGSCSTAHSPPRGSTATRST